MKSGMKKQLFHLLMHTGKLLEDRVRAGLSAGGIHHGQGRVLCAIARNGELSQIEIAHGLHIERATVTNMVQRMEKSGLIERTPDPEDQRVMKVRLTPDGKHAEACVRKVWDKIEREIRKSVPDNQLGLAGDLLTQIRNGLGGADPEL
jgi:MarR family transcriptional regulator, organic hydroperoxide resistance regulator